MKTLTAEYLQTLPTDELESITLRAVGHLTSSKLLVGRCLLAIERNGVPEQVGCSSYVHYAIVLGLAERTARTARLVARRLEDLPLLTEAAEEGTIPWTNLRAVITRATPETEERWLEIAQSYSTRIVERLVRRAQVGQNPEGSELEAPSREPERVRFVIDMERDRLAVLERAVVNLCEQEGRMVGMEEALELLAAEFLAGRSDHAARAKLLDEAERDRLAREQREAEMTVSAWDAVGATAGACPGNERVQLVVREDWRNPRLKFNEETRHATPAQRTELLRRDGYRCSTPGCCHRLWLQVHHIAFYCEHGKTVPENLVVVCSRCHRNIHLGKLRVSGSAPDQLDWRDSRGRSLNELRPVESLPPLREGMARADRTLDEEADP